MATFAFQRTAVDQSGNIIPDAEVEVRDSDGVLAALTDDTGTSITNPFNADSQGFFRFYVDTIAKYDITVSGGGRTITWKDVDIGVPEDRPLIRTPSVTSPTESESGVATNPTITGTEYSPLYSADDLNYRQFQLAKTSGSLASPDIDVQDNADFTDVGPLEPNTQYDVRIRDFSNKGDSSPWSPVVTFLTTDQYVAQPTNVSPSDGATGLSTSPTLQSSSFQTVGLSDTHTTSRWRVFDNGGTLVYDSGQVSDLVSHTITVELAKDAVHTWDVQHVGATLGGSIFSDPTSFTTTNADIQTPTVTVEGSPDGVPENPIITGSAFTMTAGTDTHQSTDWRVIETATGAAVYESLNDTENLESIKVPVGVLDTSTEYEFKARYNGALVSSDYGSATATTLSEFPVQSPFMSVAHFSSPNITIYDQRIDAFNKLSDPSTLPTGDGSAVAFSSDDTYMAVAHSTTPYVTIYKRNEGTFNKLSDPSTLPPANGSDVAFSSDVTYLAVAHISSPYVTIYKRSGDTFTKLSDPSTLPPGAGQGVAFSSDDTYMAVAHSTTPYVTIYKRSGDTFTKLSDPSTSPTGTGIGVAFSSDVTYLAVAHVSSPYVTIYKRSGDTFTKLSNPSTLPAGTGRGVVFSSDVTYMAVSHSTTPYVTIYKRSGDTFTKLSNPSTLPTGDGLGVAFSNTGYPQQ